jgi:hypothetical protein
MSKEIIEDMERELAELRRSLAADAPVHGARGQDLTAEIRAAQQGWAEDLERWLKALKADQ